MFRLKEIGKIAPVSAKNVKTSRLGIGFEKLDRGVFEPEKAYDKLGEIGVKWVRLQSGWQRTETERGVYHFEWLDSIVDNIVERGMIPWMCVCYGNQLYDEKAQKRFGAVGCMPVHTEEQKNAWAAYCTALAEHFKGRCDHFEVWNEPDGDWNIETAETAETVGTFNKDSAIALKAGNPDAYIIGGSLCNTLIKFLNRMHQTGFGEHVDAISFHEYTYDEGSVKQKVNGIKAVNKLYGFDLPVIQGESGSQSRYGGHGALHTAAWTERKQSKQLLRHLVTDLLAGVKFASYFTCVDMIEALNGKVGDVSSYLDYGYFGVLGADFDENGMSTGDYTPKQSYYVLQNLASLLGGELENIDFPVVFLPGRAPHTGYLADVSCIEASYGGFKLDDGSLALAYWYPDNIMTHEFEGATTIEVGVPKEYGKVTLVDPMDGKVYEIPDSIMKPDGFGGYVFEHLAIRDYPMFIVFSENK